MKDLEIKNELMGMIKACGLDRMPTDAEIREYFGNTSISGHVNSTGGIFEWAMRLGLPVKPSTTSFGRENELLVMRLLSERGYTCEKTSTRYPYDLLVNGCVKVDVKAARKSKSNGSDVYSFELAKPQQTCDVYVAVCLDDDKPQKIYIIPAHIMHGKTQLALGVSHSKYDHYIDRWGIIDQFTKAFKEII